MTNTVLTKTYPPMPYNRKEIRRYAGVSEELPEIESVMEECIEEVSEKLTYKVCYAEFDISRKNGITDLGFLQTASEDLAKNLDGCRKIVVFAATVGLELDRLIAKYGRISPVKALMFQALGAERIEALCDTFTADILSDREIKPRFSAGYGDFPLECQPALTSCLEAGKRVGITLTDSFLMVPSKSVTAVIGVSTVPRTCTVKGCEACGKLDCSYRRG